MAKAHFIIERDTSGDLDLRGTGVTALPENLKVGRKIFGFSAPEVTARRGGFPSTALFAPAP